MVVVLKRFGMDDVPVFLAKNWRDARRFCASYKHNSGKWATGEDERIAQTEIGMELCAFLLVSFGKNNKSIRSEVIPYHGQ